MVNNNPSTIQGLGLSELDLGLRSMCVASES